MATVHWPDRIVADLDGLHLFAKAVRNFEPGEVDLILTGTIVRLEGGFSTPPWYQSLPLGLASGLVFGLVPTTVGWYKTEVEATFELRTEPDGPPLASYRVYSVKSIPYESGLLAEHGSYVDAFNDAISDCTQQLLNQLASDVPRLYAQMQQRRP